MLFVDRLFLSMFGKVTIAASMSGGLSFFVFVAFFAGIVGYTNALTAQYFGAGKRDRCVDTAVQGFYLSFAFVPLILLLIPVVYRFFILVGHSPEQVELEFTYFRILMFGGIAVLLRNVLVGFFLGIGKSRVVMIANLIGMVVNIPINYVLIFGKLGFPEMGIKGAAIGTLIGSFTIVAILLFFFLRHGYYQGYADRARRWMFRRDVSGRLLRFGLPAGTELFLNVFAFNLFVQLMHSMGPDVAAAVTITFNYDMVAFVPMPVLGKANHGLPFLGFLVKPSGIFSLKKSKNRMIGRARNIDSELSRGIIDEDKAAQRANSINSAVLLARTYGARRAAPYRTTRTTISVFGWCAPEPCGIHMSEVSPCLCRTKPTGRTISATSGSMQLQKTSDTFLPVLDGKAGRCYFLTITDS